MLLISCVCVYVCVSCSVVSWLCDPMESSPPGSSVHEILQARILEWVAISSSRRSSWPRDQSQVSQSAGRFFTIWAIGKPVISYIPRQNKKKIFKKITKKKERTFTVYTNTSNTSMHTYTQQNISQLNCFRQDNAQYCFVLCFACLFILFLALFFLLVIALASRICIFNLDFIYLKIILYHDTLWYYITCDNII